MSSELTEGPLKQPDDDRLEMTPHAEKLARLIARSALPLTVGIYGPWGAGKTTFAYFLVDKLRGEPGWRELDLIYFSAWPYTTSTAIWQALVELIARRVYKAEEVDNTGAADKPAPPLPAAGSLDWTQQLRKSLLSNALALRPEPGNPQTDSYEKLVRRLSSSADIADRTTSAQLGGLTLGAFAKLVLGAAATMATPLGPVSQLFSGNGPAGQAPTEKTPLESIEQIRKDLHSVFRMAGEARRVVLIDDLDRCHPEIALDVLETIKIFFAESTDSKCSWLFLVPADERLVSHGLRARLGHQLDQIDDIDARSYLEKIIQVGVGLPEVKADSAHSLIADYIPEWAGASDLLVCAFDGNPRRIKQQGVLLSYSYPGSEKRSGLSRGDGNALARLVSLRARMANRDAQQVDLLAQAQDLRASDPDLDAVDPETLKVLCSVADLRPGPGGAPKTKDPVFSYVGMLTTDQDGSTTSQLLTVTYIRHLLKFRERVPDFFRLIAGYATDEGQYLPLMSLFDSWLNKRLGDEAAEAAADIRKLAEATGPLLNDPETRVLLTGEPRLPAIPAALVGLVAADDTPLPAETGVPGATDHRYAAAAVQIAGAHPEAVGTNASVLRLAVAADVLDRRKYAKVQLLLTRWPELIRLARGQGGARRLRDLEAAMLRRDQYESIPQSWRHLATDENLREFLELPPALAQYYGDDVSSIADNSAAPLLAEPLPPAQWTPNAAAQSVGSLTELPAPSPAGAAIGPYTNLELTATAASGLNGRPPAAPAVSASEVSAGATAPAQPPDPWQISLTVDGRDGRVQEKVLVDVPVDQIARLTEQLTNDRFLMSGMSSRVRPDSLSVHDVLADVGTQLWSLTLGASPDIETLFTRAFETESRLRLAVNSSAGMLNDLPWECLFLPRHGIFAAQTLKLSVIRQVTDPAPLPSFRPSSPLRLLIAEASPPDMPLLSADQEISLIHRSLEQPQSAGLVRIEVIRDATVDKLWPTIQSFKPHVVHFIGHASFDHGNGVIVLVDENGRAHLVEADSLGLLMQERGVLLAFLNGCQTAWPNPTDTWRSAAQTLVLRGIPAVIGTTRDLADTTALRFAGEFYKSMGDGLSVEPALVEARKALSVKGWDWSMYAMYANTQFPLHTIRIQLPLNGPSAA